MELRKWHNVPDHMVEVVTIQADGSKSVGWIALEYWELVQKAYAKVGIRMEKLDKPTLRD